MNRFTSAAAEVAREWDACDPPTTISPDAVRQITNAVIGEVIAFLNDNGQSAAGAMIFSQAIEDPSPKEKREAEAEAQRKEEIAQSLDRLLMMVEPHGEKYVGARLAAGCLKALKQEFEK